MFKPVNVNDIPNFNINRRKEYGKRINVQEEIKDFISSGLAAAEIEVPDDRYARSVCASFARAIKEKSYPVFVINRGKRVFLAKKEDK